MLKANYEAEQAVLAAILMDATETMPLIASIVSPNDFYSELKTIYKACYELSKQNKPIDVVTVLSMVGNEYKTVIMAAAAAVPSISHCTEYAQLVHERAQKIRAYNKATDLLEALDIDESDTKCQEIASNVLQCFDTGTGEETVSAEQGFLQFCETQDKAKVYIKTGFSNLDRFTYIDRGDYVIVGGRPSAGKTALTLQIMLHMAQQNRIAYFSLETKPSKVFDRLISTYTRTPLSSIKTNSISEAQWADITNSFDQFHKLKFDIVQAAGFTVEQIKSKAIQLHSEIIFVDYAGLIKSEGKSTYEKATNTSNSLHTLAQQCGITVVALSQLNRDGKSTPDMTNLRDSGAYEQDADTILLLNYNDDKQDQRELIIAKNKEGRTGRIQLAFDGQRQRFSEMETRYREG